MKPVEAGMEVFPCPVEADAPVTPVAQPELSHLQSAFPTPRPVHQMRKLYHCLPYVYPGDGLGFTHAKG